MHRSLSYNTLMVCLDQFKANFDLLNIYKVISTRLTDGCVKQAIYVFSPKNVSLLLKIALYR